MSLDRCCKVAAVRGGGGGGGGVGVGSGRGGGGGFRRVEEGGC